jgi:Ulp1 family protease
MSNFINLETNESSKKRKLEENIIPPKKYKIHHISQEEINSMQNDSLLSGTLVEYVTQKLIEPYKEHQMVSAALSAYLSKFENEESDFGYLSKRIFELSAIDWNKKGFVFIPWNLSESQHWVLIVIDLKINKIYFFDSLGKNYFYQEVAIKIKYWLALSVVDAPSRIKNCEIINCTKNKIHQKFGQSCGAFVCFYVELLTRNLTIQQILNHKKSNSDDIISYRYQMYLRIKN